MSVPVTPDPRLEPVTGGYSIVVARTLAQSDPIPIPCGAVSCTSWFLGTFDQAETIAGNKMPPKFSARLVMGSPFDQQYRLALLVETLPDGTHRVRASRGFHYQTHLACFDVADTERLTPQPTGPRLGHSGRQLCVK